MKKCTKCGKEQPIDRFPKDSSRPSGIYAYCRGCVKARDDLKYNNHKARILKRNSIYRKNNADKIRVTATRYAYKRSKIDVIYKLKCRLRTRLWDALNGRVKIGSAVRDLGCSVKELKTHLESKFKVGMSWSNYGKKGWTIDHIKPLASFDLTDRQQFLMACHYTNLQPLWEYENTLKGTKR